ncbi:hypothetical protein [Streptomyces sp. RFCAC02]|uniref:hypothetical protein n=1 Tax=Streptomyces sp. RFCAC02 TaxID=2499143 RepID=UPI001021412B|nr:hypothetical protein [Streptomyces sp. RFCAC02]
MDGITPGSPQLDALVRTTFADLTSRFMTLPRGDAFLDYPDFRAGYEALRRATGGFARLDPGACRAALAEDARAFVVLRTVLGVSPPEWADLTAEETGLVLPAGAARMMDSRARRDPAFFRGASALVGERVTAMLEAACTVLAQGAGGVPDGLLHRLDKFDTAHGPESVAHAAAHDVPYAAVLYERFLGRPFASHRDAVSEIVGDVMENAVETLLTAHGVPFRRTRRAERLPGFEQAPDFFVPDELAPAVVIEAKITGDDGTARDKVARLLRLAAMRDARERAGRPSFELVACVDGRGFGVRRQDMRDLLCATNGKVFTLATLPALITHTGISAFTTA